MQNARKVPTFPFSISLSSEEKIRAVKVRPWWGIACHHHWGSTMARTCVRSRPDADMRTSRELPIFDHFKKYLVMQLLVEEFIKTKRIIFLGFVLFITKLLNYLLEPLFKKFV